MGEVLPQSLGLGDAAVASGAAVGLVGDLGEVFLGCFVADGDVDLALADDEVGDLVVAAAAQALALQVFAREDMVLVASVEQQIAHGDVGGEKTFVAEPGLGGLVGDEVGALCRGGVHQLRQHAGPVAIGQLVLDHGLDVFLHPLGLDLADVLIEGSFGIA